MKPSAHFPLRLLLVAAVMIAAGCTGAARAGSFDTCQFYGYVPHTHDYSVCRMNARHYWSTGPCSDARFAAVHRRYCHLDREFDF